MNSQETGRSVRTNAARPWSGRALVGVSLVGALMLAAGAPSALAQSVGDPSGAFGLSGETAADHGVSQAALDQALAGLALYPDSLLSQVLIACTYPIEVVQADRWVKANPNVKGNALAAALEAQPWDPSVKSLVNFPDVLGALSENLEATAVIGDAFVADEARVMDTIQSLRARANERGNLQSNDEQRIVVQRAADSPRTTIVIESAQPDVIYVPVYDPVVVYGSWWWPAWQPVVYCRPTYWAPGPVVWWGRPRYCGPAWGYAWSQCDWGGSFISINIGLNFRFNHHIDRHRYIEHCDRRFGWHEGRGRWRHDSEHRRGFAYRDERSAREHGGRSIAQAERSREGWRERAAEGRREIEGEGGGIQGSRSGEARAHGAGRRSAEGRGGEGGGIEGRGSPDILTTPDAKPIASRGEAPVTVDPRPQASETPTTGGPAGGTTKERTVRRYADRSPSGTNSSGSGSGKSAGSAGGAPSGAIGGAAGGNSNKPDAPSSRGGSAGGGSGRGGSASGATGRAGSNTERPSVSAGGSSGAGGSVNSGGSVGSSAKGGASASSVRSGDASPSRGGSAAPRAGASGSSGKNAPASGGSSVGSGSRSGERSAGSSSAGSRSSESSAGRSGAASGSSDRGGGSKGGSAKGGSGRGGSAGSGGGKRGD